MMICNGLTFLGVLIEPIFGSLTSKTPYLFEILNNIQKLSGTKDEVLFGWRENEVKFCSFDFKVLIVLFK